MRLLIDSQGQEYISLSSSRSKNKKHTPLLAPLRNLKKYFGVIILLDFITITLLSAAILNRSKSSYSASLLTTISTLTASICFATMRFQKLDGVSFNEMRKIDLRTRVHVVLMYAMTTLLILNLIDIMLLLIFNSSFVSLVNLKF